MGFLFEPFSSPASIGLRTFGGPSANAGYAVWRIDSRHAAGLHLSTCFPPKYNSIVHPTPANSASG